MLEKNPNRDLQPPKINLNRRPGQPPFMVDMQGFFEFSFWMAEELLDLEAQYRPQKKSQLATVKK